MSRVVKMCIFSAFSKFENHIISSHKQDTLYKILVFFKQSSNFFSVYMCVALVQVLIKCALFVNNIIYEHIKSVHFVCHESLSQRNCISLHYTICRQIKDSSFVYISMNFFTTVSHLLLDF